MPKLEYFLVCESISVDRETNRVSLFNVVEDIQPVPLGTPGLPIAQLTAVSSWNREPGDEGQDFQALFRIHSPDAEPQDFRMNFRMEGSRQRLLFRMQGIPPAKPGELRFELLLNEQHIANHVVTVHPPPEPPPSP